MNMFIVIIAALLPVLLLFGYIYGKDSLSPEPPAWLWRATVYGVLSAFLVLGWGHLIPSFDEIFPAWTETWKGSVGRAFWDAAIPEEGFKLLMLCVLIRRNPYFDERMDGIVYATCVGLGFAGFENILYLFSNLDSFVSVAVMRALFSVPGHFFFAVSMGYFVSLAYFGRNKKLYYVLAYLVPVLLHGVFDGILMSMSVLPALYGLLIVVFLLFTHYLRKLGRRQIDNMRGS